MENQPKINKIVLWTALTLIIILIILSLASPVNRALHSRSRVNLLLLGSDNVEDSKRADVIMLISYHPRGDFVDIVSIPRDSRVHIPKYKLLRINEFFAYGYKEGGIAGGAELTRDAVQSLLKIEIPYYLELDFTDVIRIINALGGIKIDVAEKMDYDDNWGKLHIHFKPGRQILNGQQAIEYLRFRKDSTGDLGRMQRNRSFLKALAERIKSPAVFFHLPQVLVAGLQSLHSNMKFYDLVTFIFESRKLSTKNIRQQQLPGKPATVRGAWVWEIDSARLEQVTKLLRDESIDNELAVKNIRVDLWNATRDREAVREITTILRGKGIDVLSWGYYEKILPRSKIINRTGSLSVANKLNSIFQCDDIETSLSDTSLTQAVIIIGEDWRKKIAKF